MITKDLTLEKPWVILGITRKKYEACKPWKATRYSRKEYEEWLRDLPAVAVTEIRLAVDGERLTREIFNYISD